MTSSLYIPSRRTVLTGLIAAPTVLMFGRSYAAGGPLFTLGVASGDPAPGGFVLWTRLASDPLAPDGAGGMSGPVLVRWQVFADEGLRRLVTEGEAVAEASGAHALHVEVAGLQPDRPYWYRFIAEGQDSPVGLARTAPHPDAMPERLRLAVASCSSWEVGYFSAYRHMAEENPDLVLFLGDYIYEYSLGAARAADIVRPYNLEEATTLAGYRNRYALHRTDADLQRLHAAAPCLAIWDDHEVQDDYSGVWSKVAGVHPRDFVQRRAAAYRAFYDHMPLRPSVRRGEEMSLYRSIRYGRLAEFAMLDGRQYRSRQPCPSDETGGKGQIVTDSTCMDRADPSRTFLGFDQERWLYEGLARSDARWNVLAQNLVMAGLRFGAGGDQETRYWTDTWDGFPGARDRLMEALQVIRPRNPVVLSGDYHSFWTNDVKARSEDPDSETLATEFVGTSITSNGPPHDSLSAAMRDNPQNRFFDARSRGYMTLELDPSRMQTRYRAISDRRDPQATVSTLASWAVEDGRPGAQQA